MLPKGQDRGSVLRCSFTTAFGFRAEHDRLHVLINNAGVNLTHRSVSGDGFETTFAVNHLGPFLLTNLLLDLLRHSAPSRVVIVTSSAFRRGRIKFRTTLRSSGASPASAPNRSKLTNLLYTEGTRRSPGGDRRDSQLRASRRRARYRSRPRGALCLTRPGDLGHDAPGHEEPPNRGPQTSVSAATAPDLKTYRAASSSTADSRTPAGLR
jgi:NAD(P)-dependent dehydrogenase (short-subunit alcohol dehydrogenase family)